jgi:hypothetical protein
MNHSAWTPALPSCNPWCLRDEDSFRDACLVRAVGASTLPPGDAGKRFPLPRRRLPGQPTRVVWQGDRLAAPVRSPASSGHQLCAWTGWGLQALRTFIFDTGRSCSMIERHRDGTPRSRHRCQVEARLGPWCLCLGAAGSAHGAEQPSSSKGAQRLCTTCGGPDTL